MPQDIFAASVLVPYKITLLSNDVSGTGDDPSVLVPYKITLLSNDSLARIELPDVLVPYKITLLSNLKFEFKCCYGQHV